MDHQKKYVIIQLKKIFQMFATLLHDEKCYTCAIFDKRSHKEDDHLKNTRKIKEGLQKKLE